jgi:hypothetical protein
MQIQCFGGRRNIYAKVCELDRQHNKRKDIFKVETKQMLWCLLLVYCKQVYATCFDLYLGHHQANSINHELSCFKLVALI